MFVWSGFEPAAAGLSRVLWAVVIAAYTDNERHSPIAGSMLGQRLRRWPNIEQTMAQCLVIAAYKEDERHWRGVVFAMVPAFGKVAQH